MIVKRTLSPRRILAYTRGPMTWTLAWALAATALAVVLGAATVAIPFAPVAALGAALAIFVAFRNNTAFGRWNEARAAWQAVLVACRSIGRQVVAATDNAAASGTASREDADRVTRDLIGRLVAFAHALAHQVRPHPDDPSVAPHASADEWATVAAAANPAHQLLVRQSVAIKSAIRDGALGQFDPISLEPQMAALASAQGVLERLASTPTPRQYDYFTRIFVLAYAALVPFGLLSVLPDALWLVMPLALVLAGVFVIMAVVGATNDEPMSGTVTDVPIHAVCREIERDAADALNLERPPALQPVDGYLW
jgi:putative membrane protein